MSQYVTKDSICNIKTKHFQHKNQIKMEKIGERLSKLLENKGLTVYAFCKKTGTNNASIGRIINKGAKPNEKTLNTICDFFNVSKDWLLTGKGAMYRNKYESNIVNLFKEKTSEHGGNRFIELEDGRKLMAVPFVDQTAQAGFISGFADAEDMMQLPYHFVTVNQYHKGDYYAFKVIGDSMDDGTKNTIEQGDIITGRVIDKSLWRNKFHIHKFKNYIIVHKEGILVKEIIAHDTENGCITIHSLNKNFEDDVIMLDDCIMILNVVDINKKP